MFRLTNNDTLNPSKNAPSVSIALTAACSFEAQDLNRQEQELNENNPHFPEQSMLSSQEVGIVSENTRDQTKRTKSNIITAVLIRVVYLVFATVMVMKARASYFRTKRHLELVDCKDVATPSILRGDIEKDLRILGVIDAACKAFNVDRFNPPSADDYVKQYKKMAGLLHPDKNKHKDATAIFQRFQSYHNAISKIVYQDFNYGSHETVTATRKDVKATGIFQRLRNAISKKDNRQEPKYRYCNVSTIQTFYRPIILDKKGEAIAAAALKAQTA